MVLATSSSRAQGLVRTSSARPRKLVGMIELSGLKAASVEAGRA